MNERKFNKKEKKEIIEGIFSVLDSEDIQYLCNKFNLRFPSGFFAHNAFHIFPEIHLKIQHELWGYRVFNHDPERPKAFIYFSAFSEKEKESARLMYLLFLIEFYS